MKKALLSAVALCLTVSAMAQDGMGIGNTNPQEMLDVSGAIRIGTTTSTNVGTIRWNGTNFQGYDGTQWVNLDASSGADSDWTISGSNQYSAVSGSVGIGTNTPSNKLHVSSTINQLLLQNPTNNGSVGIIMNEGAGGGSNAAFIHHEGDFSTGYLEIEDYSSGWSNTGLVVKQNNVGVGTVNPGAKLEVTGQLKITGGSPGLNKVLTSDATGLAAWVDPNNLVTTETPIFANTSGVTSNENGTYDSDDFVFGSPQLADNGNNANDSRFFFDKSKSAFRAGTVQSTQWDDANVGSNSVAFGSGNTASGSSSASFGTGNTSSGTASLTSGSNNSVAGGNSVGMGFGNTVAGGIAVALGNTNSASAAYAVAIGANNSASGQGAIAIGSSTSATQIYATALGVSTTASASGATALGSGSTASGSGATALGNGSTASGTASSALGRNTVASGTYSTAFGDETTASGRNAIAGGANVTAESGYETVLGRYDTDYTPGSTSGWNASDRLFVLGNGTSSVARSNALTVFKDGTVNINDAYNLPNSDGSAGQVLTTDGSGTASWSAPSAGTGLADDDNDTKVQVEESSDEDKIRFDTGGSERMIIDDNGNVGVGTSSPVNLLHVQNDVSGLNFPVFLRNSSITAGDGVGIGFLSEPNGNWTKAGIYYERTAGFGVGKLHLLVDDGTDNQSVTLSESRVTVKADGNVGIGTTTPSAKLDIAGRVYIDVDGTGPNPGFEMPPSSGTNGRVLTTDGSGNASWNNPVTATYGEDVLGSSYTIPSGSYGNTGLSVNLPSAGTYRIFYSCGIKFTASAEYVACRLYNVTGSAVVSNSYSGVRSINSGINDVFTIAMESFVTVSGATTIRVEASGATGSSSHQLVTSAHQTSKVTYVKISD